MRYQFLIDSYETERFKVLSVWSMFDDEDLLVRPHLYPSKRLGWSSSLVMARTPKCVSIDLASTWRVSRRTQATAPGSRRQSRNRAAVWRVQWDPKNGFALFVNYMFPGPPDESHPVS